MKTSVINRILRSSNDIVLRIPAREFPALEKLPLSRFTNENFNNSLLLTIKDQQEEIRALRRKLRAK